MEHKNIVATIYLKDGKAVQGREDTGEGRDILKLAKMYNDTGIDKLFCVDLSNDDEEHEKNILAIREINRSVDVKICGGGNIKRLEDVKKFLYAGCVEVVLNGAKPDTIKLLKEAAERFGKEKMLVSINTLDFVFKNAELMSSYVHEILVMNKELVKGLEDLTDVPYILCQKEYDLDEIEKLLSSDKIRGIYGDFINDTTTDIMNLKAELSERNILMDNFAPKLKWSDLKTNSDGLVPCIVQDYRTDEVLMLAYMNEESFNTTIKTGKMTYYSRSRRELWIKGEVSGHTQYVKSLTADCDFDTLLAKVSQVGGIACHTGAPNCFFNEIIKKEYVERNPLKVLEDVYKVILDRKANPKEGSYTNYLFDKGLDKILKKVGEEATEIVIASKNTNNEEVIYEISDFIYHLMVLMAEKDVTWEDIIRELAQR